MTHGLFGFNPGPAAHSPSGTRLQTEPHTQPVRLGGGVAHEVLPFGRQALYGLLGPGPNIIVHASVKELNALYARLSDSLQVACDTFPTYVPIYKVEPCLGIEDAVRVLE